jgi:hypothetical protein
MNFQQSKSPLRITKAWSPEPGSLLGPVFEIAESGAEFTGPGAFCR